MNPSASYRSVKVDSPGPLCSAAYVLRGVLERNINRPDVNHILDDLDMTLHIQAGRMKFTVILNKGAVEIKDGHQGRASARLRAPFRSFMALIMRRLPLRDILAFRVIATGNIFKLITALPLLEYHEPIPPELMEGG